MRKNIKRGLNIAIALWIAFIFCAAPSSAAEKHKVEKGETLEMISLTFIVSIDDIKKWNHLERTAAVEGDTLRIPEKRSQRKALEKAPGISVSEDEKKLLARLVHAEAKGEPYEGKVAVASVVLNRVEHDEFPDSVKKVIYEKNAFSPVGNGSIQNKPDQESKKAADEALKRKSVHYLYFFNSETAESEWIKTRKIKETIGNHSFAM
ncbi:cell wall hydrolase [Metabacillus sp. 84]|uniref:cell wall hydrolase n=1 Tax=Metabacillus sp. 84 TaxID=3404705 RepID=UPI003CF8B400